MGASMEEKIARINQLYHKSQKEGLTGEEKEEQKRLRAEYVANIRENLKVQLDSIRIRNLDGSITKPGAKAPLRAASEVQGENFAQSASDNGDSPPDKQTSRRRALAARDALTYEERREKDAAILERLCESALYRTHRILLLYASFGSEVDTWNVMERAWRDGKEVYLPLVQGESMTFCRVCARTDLREGFHGILEPGREAPAWNPGEAPDTLLVCPGVAFDRSRHRIGYGKGFYDRFLGECGSAGNRPDSVALCYEAQLFSEIRHDESDEKPDWILTEEGML